MWLLYPILCHHWNKRTQGLTVHCLLLRPSCQCDVIAVNIQASDAHLKKHSAKNGKILPGPWALREQKILGQEGSACVLQGVEYKPLCPEKLIPSVTIMETRLGKDLGNTLQGNFGSRHALCTGSWLNLFNLEELLTITEVEFHLGWHSLGWNGAKGFGMPVTELDQTHFRMWKEHLFTFYCSLVKSQEF